MRTYLNRISGIDDAIVSLFMSKRSWTREMELRIRKVCQLVLRPDGGLIPYDEALAGELEEFAGWMDKLVKWGTRHMTMLRFIDLSVTVEGLHRAGQDDWDAHAMRFGNRIIRSSTRLAKFSYEMSEWYEDKILPTDLALQALGVELPDSFQHGGETYVKAVNGYIKEGLQDDPDVKRGLYMLSIPSNFIFKVDLTEWAHVFKERNAGGHANPEVKRCCESIADQVAAFHPQFDRELFLSIPN